MNPDAAVSHRLLRAIDPSWPGWRRATWHGENLLVVLALAAMMMLPVVEIVLRSVFRTGISGSSSIVQHLTLIVGMLGGALAAREGRLLRSVPGANPAEGKAEAEAHILSSAFAARITVFLCLASFQYVMAVRPLGKILVYGIPVWVIQLFCHSVSD